MGKILQIRVSASTPFPDEVPRQWPQLCALAWPNGLPNEPDVLGLAQTLYDQYRFATEEHPVWNALVDSIGGLTQCRRELEEALADWQPREANQASDRLEDMLVAMEAAVAAQT
ncbi:MAG: hypothetical protein ACQESV_03120 [Thermodesulfobacteriota bacterium]